MPRIVQVRVQEKRPGGLIVQLLSDKRLGYIRRRELSWDRGIHAEHSEPVIGSIIQAQVIDDSPLSQYTQLSVRQLTDPWQAVQGKYRKGQIVRGEVVHLRNNKVYVQLEPGIEAFLSNEELPITAKHPSEFFPLLGDIIEAVVTYVDEGEQRQYQAEQRLNISVLQHLNRISQFTIEERKLYLLEQFRDISNPQSIVEEPNQNKENFQRSTTKRLRPPLVNFERVLIVDDDEKQLFDLWDELERTFDIVVRGAQSRKEALTILNEEQKIDLAIIDMTLLEGETGIDLARVLLEVLPNLEIVFVSNNFLNAKTIPLINGRKFLFSPKQKEEIIGVIEKIVDGYWEPSGLADGAMATTQGNFVKQLGINLESSDPTLNKLENLLDAIRLNAEVARAILFEVDKSNQTASITISVPPLARELRRKAEDRLYYSPVRNVGEDKEEYFWSAEESHRERELQNFLPQLHYESCCGIPIVPLGTNTYYALFLLDHRIRKFDQENIDSVRVGAQFIQLTLERMLHLDFMRRYEQRYTMGLLLNSLVHETVNKLDGLNAQIQSLPLVLSQIERSHNDQERNIWIEDANTIASELRTIHQDIASLMASYSRAVIGQVEAVSLNTVILKVKQQFQKRAQEAGVVVEYLLSDGVPSVQTIPSRLEQILTNLLLNAIQQIERQHKTLIQYPPSRNKSILLPKPGLVIVKTYYSAIAEAFPVHIAVIDSGPGVHYQQQKEIFLMDTSKRRHGQGLGLFISRSLLEMMGGRLYLAESVYAMGSAFVVELPIIAEHER